MFNVYSKMIENKTWCLIWLIYGTFLFVENRAQGQSFEDIGGSAGLDILHTDPHLIGGGVAIFDFNNDGLQDIYITGGDNRDHLYLNGPNGKFTEIGLNAGIGLTQNIATVGVAIGDIDNNGNNDILVTTRDNSENILWYNNGDDTVTNIASIAGLVEQAWSTSAAFGDYNLDGYLDIYISNYVSYVHPDPVLFYTDEMQGQANLMYLNNGDNTFNEVAAKLGLDDMGAGLAVTFSDLDHDNDLDIYLGNDFPNEFGKNVLFENMYPIDSFRNIGKDSRTDIFSFSMGIGIADYNNDDALDIYVTNIGGNFLLRNNKNGTFTDKAFNLNARCLEPVSWGTFFFDYNNDSQLDIFVATGGMLEDDKEQEQPNHLLEGSPSLFFEEETHAAELKIPSRSRGTAYGDFDNDGYTDLVLVNIDYSNGAGLKSTLFRNKGADNHWLGVELQGVNVNRNGYGAQVRVFSGEEFWLQEMSGGSGYLSHNSNILHFGLGQITAVDSIEVTWLGGNKQVIKDVMVDKVVTIIEQCYDIEAIEATVCAYEGMVIGGINRTASGTYEEIIEQHEGCDTKKIVALTVEQCITVIPEQIDPLKIYPNPAKEYLFIETGINMQKRMQVVISDLSGKKVFNEWLDTTTSKINLQHFSPGIYMVYFDNYKQMRPVKFIKL